MKPRNVLLVDLNNFATFPTLAVGILIAALRNAGHEVRLVVPLAYGVPSSSREHAEGWRHHLMRRVHLSTFPSFRLLRELLRSIFYWFQRRPEKRVLREVSRALSGKPDILLLSAYLQHYATVVEIGKLAEKAEVPLLLGGPAFNLPETADAWREVPGLAALVGAEVDGNLSAIVDTLLEGGDLLQFEGIVLPDGRRSREAKPFRQLDRSPLPDYSDFPWDRYPVRIVPLMTGRGCQWARCTFCSDVVSVNGRTFRSHGLEAILHEIREQSRRHGTSNFLFLDLKLNSNPAIFRGVAEHIQDCAPGAQWIGTVHVDGRKDNGLSRQDLRAAVRSGMRRISFGLESGSQRMLDLMDKGSTVENNSRFVREAHSAGLSVRCTMFKGYPGETATDLEKTADFLEVHSAFLDRVRFNEFSVIENTPIWHSLFDASRTDFPLRPRGKDSRQARARYINRQSGDAAYRKAKARVLRSVFEINRRKLRAEAQMFDGLM